MVNIHISLHQININPKLSLFLVLQGKDFPYFAYIFQIQRISFENIAKSNKLKESLDYNL